MTACFVTFIKQVIKSQLGISTYVFSGMEKATANDDIITGFKISVFVWPTATYTNLLLDM